MPGARTKPPMPRGLILVGIVIAAMVGFALWAGVGALRQHPLVGTVSRYQVTSDTTVTYSLIITGVANTDVTCAVVARGEDFSIVGQQERKVHLDADGGALITGTVTTLRQAANAEAGTCQGP